MSEMIPRNIVNEILNYKIGSVETIIAGVDQFGRRVWSIIKEVPRCLANTIARSRSPSRRGCSRSSAGRDVEVAHDWLLAGHLTIDVPKQRMTRGKLSAKRHRRTINAIAEALAVAAQSGTLPADKLTIGWRPGDRPLDPLSTEGNAFPAWRKRSLNVLVRVVKRENGDIRAEILAEILPGRSRVAGSANAAQCSVGCSSSAASNVKYRLMFWTHRKGSNTGRAARSSIVSNSDASSADSTIGCSPGVDEG
jgi:hypothetical protein